MDGELVDETREQVLLRSRRAAADQDILAVRRGDCLLECALDALGHELEGRPALHLERRALMVGEDEHRGVVRRILAPPTPPLVVLPRASDRPEHVAPHDRRADVLAPRRGMPVVDGRLPSLLAVPLTPAPCREHPFVDRLAALAEWIVEALVGPGDVPVERHRDVDPEPRHARHRAATPSAARSSSSITIFLICSIAETARCARSGSGSAISS